MTTTITVAAHMTDGTRRDLPAQPTTIPGLYVTRAADLDATFGKAWRLTHGPSGRALPYWGPTAEHCHDLATALAKVRADWSDLPADLAQWPAGLQQDINRVGGDWECRRHRRRQPEFFWPVTTGAAS